MSKKTHYFMHGISESGDRYQMMGKWDHFPFDDEILEALWDVDMEEAYSDDEKGPAAFPDGEFFQILNGVRYVNYVHWEIEEC